MFRKLCLTIILSVTFHSELRAAHDNKLLAAMGSAKGLAAFAFGYNMLNGGATWAWAWDSTRNNGTSVETKALIQEIGGLTSAGLTWVVAGFVPFYAFLYAQHINRNEDDFASPRPGESRILRALSSPLGIAVVAFVYQTLRGAATFVWAYDWTRYGVADADTKVRIQEAGGMASAALAWSLGGIIPFYCYLYSAYIKPDGDANRLPVLRGVDTIFNMMATPRGIAVTAFFTSLLDGTSSFVWAYNWMRDGLSAEASARIQEAGGIASAVICWTVAGFVPFYLYSYMSLRERLAISQRTLADGTMRQVVLGGVGDL